MLQEDRQNLTNLTQDKKRAIDSIKEEFEAVDYYHQRAEACEDENLKNIFIHNANEEKEHVAMLIEWLRQKDEKFSEEVKDYLFAEKEDIASLEE